MTSVKPLEAIAIGVLNTVVFACVWVYCKRNSDARCNAMLQEMQTLQDALDYKERLRLEERKGRVSTEKELRQLMQERLDTTRGHFIQAIGTIQSCFQTCLGTPRQGLLAPSTQAYIDFDRSISPDTLDGLEEFSYVWITFIFHANTNGKNARAHQGLRSDSHRHTFRAKISPPMLKQRVGIFATRSPHRPNPVGITLAKIERVDKSRLYISGVDLVTDTPVVDIKPYVPSYDSLPDAQVAKWVAIAQPVVHVGWQTPELQERILELASSSKHYKNKAFEMMRAIEQVLQVDVRSKDQTKRMLSERVNELSFDNTIVKYVVRQSIHGEHVDSLKANENVQKLTVDIVSISRVP